MSEIIFPPGAKTISESYISATESPVKNGTDSLRNSGSTEKEAEKTTEQDVTIENCVASFELCQARSDTGAEVVILSNKPDASVDQESDNGENSNQESDTLDYKNSTDLTVKEEENTVDEVDAYISMEESSNLKREVIGQKVIILDSNIEIATFSKASSAFNKLRTDYRCDSDSDSYDSESDSSSSSNNSKKSKSDESSDSEEYYDVDDEKEKSVTPLKVKGEMDLRDLPPIQELNINVPECECTEIGKITSIVNTLVIIESYRNTPALNLDTVLFLDKGNRALGVIFDVLGPIHEPVYTVRFNSSDDIKEKGITKGLPVFYASKSDLTSYIFVAELMKFRGSDASWKDNVEPPPECQDFSDDDQEIKAMAKFRNAERKTPLSSGANCHVPKKQFKHTPHSSRFKNMPNRVHQPNSFQPFRQRPLIVPNPRFRFRPQTFAVPTALQTPLPPVSLNCVTQNRIPFRPFTSPPHNQNQPRINFNIPPPNSFNFPNRPNGNNFTTVPPTRPPLQLNGTHLSPPRSSPQTSFHTRSPPMSFGVPFRSQVRQMSPFMLNRPNTLGGNFTCLVPRLPPPPPPPPPHAVPSSSSQTSTTSSFFSKVPPPIFVDFARPPPIPFQTNSVQSFNHTPATRLFLPQQRPPFHNGNNVQSASVNNVPPHLQVRNFRPSPK